MDKIIMREIKEVDASDPPYAYIIPFRWWYHVTTYGGLFVGDRRYYATVVFEEDRDLTGDGLERQRAIAAEQFKKVLRAKGIDFKKLIAPSLPDIGGVIKEAQIIKR